MRRSRRGFLLVAALLITVILLVSGLGVMSAQASRYNASARIAEGIQAKNAAMSGLEDVRVKLAKDVKFPPRKSKARGQTKYAYSETLFEDPDDPNAEVSYSVVVDFALEREVAAPNRWEPYRWGLYKVTVSGYVGPRDTPIAQSQLYAEYNIDTGEFIRFEDRGSL
jgi:hypothetical protein